MSRVKKSKFTSSHALIALCWLVYACSYIGKLSYNANINQIGKAFGASYSECGMVSTFFFFAYGIGQIVNGFMCKRYNKKYVIFASLIVTSGMNLLIPFITDFSLLKYVWLVCGIATSFLWTSLIHLLSVTLPDKYINMAIFAMGTTVATGTFIVYGASAAFAAFFTYKATFIFAASAIFAVSLVWLFSFNKLVKKDKCDTVSNEELHTEDIKISEKKPSFAAFAILFSVFATFAIANNLIKDGLNVWTPDILSKIYNTPGWLSILLTLLLPVMAMMGTVVVIKLQSKTKNFVASMTVLSSVSVVLIATILALLSTSMIALTVICFSLVCCLMSGINNVITSMFPLSMKSHMNSGKLAGILNGFCYLGSTISAYGLGLIADNFGWSSVFVTMLVICSAVSLFGLVYVMFFRKKGFKLHTI